MNHFDLLGEGATELINIGQAVINLNGTVDFFVNKSVPHVPYHGKSRLDFSDAPDSKGLALTG
jgi:hypothetical protein